jgi:acyl-CoA dehydrogenase
VHGGARVTDDFALAMAWAHLRTLRLADGPDEVHKRAIARHDLGKHRDQDAWTSQSITRRSSVSIPRRRRDARWSSEGN